MASTAEGSAAIEVRGLTKSFGARAALRGISFRVDPGEVVAFLGPNGAGKSTTIRILTGQLARDGGEARVLGIDPAVDPLAIRRRLAFVPDVPPLYDALTVREQLELIAGLRGLDDATTAARVDALMDAMGITALAGVPLSACSRGNRQRTAIATGFLEEPGLVILDEPLFGLDAPTVLLVKEILRKLAARGTAVFYSDHLLDVAESLATRVVIVADGEIVARRPAERAGGRRRARLAGAGLPRAHRRPRRRGTGGTFPNGFPSHGVDRAPA
jgi:ABC-type multidrug transport system ATPase subunit